MIDLKKKVLSALIASALVISGVAQAEYFGLPSARSASPDNLSDLSVELAFVRGDFYDSDYQNIGARVNYRVSPELVLIGDIGLSEFGLTDGTPAGLGLLYHLANQRISQNLDIAGKVSYHEGTYEKGVIKYDLSGLSFEALFSGRRPLTAGGLNWYGNIGFHRLSVEESANDTSTEIGVGGGLILPIDSGEVFFGVDHIDVTTYGLGFRYFVR